MGDFRLADRFELGLGVKTAEPTSKQLPGPEISSTTQLGLRHQRQRSLNVVSMTLESASQLRHAIYVYEI